MKLDYAALISPYPLYLQNVGHIRAPTLGEIWNPDITYQGYNSYLSMLLATLKNQLSVFEWITASEELQNNYCHLLDFFFEEDVIWDNANQRFITYNSADQNGAVIPVGMMTKECFADVCNIILQRCGCVTNDIDTIDSSKVKSKRALEIFNKIQNAKKKSKPKKDKAMELPNLITAVAVKSNSINFTNIWNLTVFQLYEQFRREYANVYFDIQKMSVAAYGNEKKTFKGTEWFHNESEEL